MPSRRHPLKGVILAAGFGNRLRPLTDKTPKPLLPFFNQPMLHHLLLSFTEVGITQVMVNAHYLWRQLEEFIQETNLPIEVSLSIEQEEPLGTGGAYGPMHRWRQGSDLLAINGDIFHRYNLAQFIDKHYQQNNYASMALTPKPIENETKLWVKKGKLVSFGDQEIPHSTPHGFACLQILSDKFLQQIPKKEPTSIIPFYRKALLENKEIGAYIGSGFWADIGTPKKYLEAQIAYLKSMTKKNPTKGLFLEKQKGKYEITPPCFIHPLCEIQEGSFIGPNVIISAPSIIPKGCRIKNTLIIDPVTLSEYSSFDYSILGKGLAVQDLS